LQILSRDRMDVPSKCAIVRAMGRSVCAPEVSRRKNKGQNGDKTQNHIQRIGVARSRRG
jgi:hypothetical protein